MYTCSTTSYSIRTLDLIFRYFFVRRAWENEQIRFWFSIDDSDDVVCTLLVANFIIIMIIIVLLEAMVIALRYSRDV